MSSDSAIHTPNDASFISIVVKSAVVHTATYFLVGLFAVYAFNYAESFETGPLDGYMRPVTDQLVMLGPTFQPIRGALFGVVFYLLRDVLFARTNGWLLIWAMLAIIGIVNPFGPAPGSIEGAIYTQMSFPTLYEISLVEVYGQALMLAAGVFFWVRNPANRWLGWGFSVVAAFAVFASLGGSFLAPMAG